MKVIVITRFKDKYTKMWHNVGDILTNVSEDRYAEIKKFVKVIKDDVDTKTSKKTSSKRKSKANR